MAGGWVALLDLTSIFMRGESVMLRLGATSGWDRESEKSNLAASKYGKAYLEFDLIN